MSHKHIFHVPELDLNDQQRSIIAERYYKLKEANPGVGFVSVDRPEGGNNPGNIATTSSSGEPVFKYITSGISLLDGVYSKKQIQQIKNLCPPKEGMNDEEPFDFLETHGKVLPHIDDMRQAVLTVPIIEKGHTLEFYPGIGDDVSEILEEMTYNNRTFIFNSKINHGVRTSESMRLFWQGSIFKKTFSTIKEEYNQGKLFR
tara:strand:+ start:528 stop:1133 length:606 start_codon:yes stop_codon:yes gene_type:complete